MKQRVSRLQRQLNSESGVTLVMVLMVLMVLSVLGVSLITVALGNTRLASVEREYEGTYYIAEAGATYRLAKVETSVKGYYDQMPSEHSFYDALEREIIGSKPYSDFEPVMGNQPEAMIQIQKVSNDNPRKYKITSTGNIGNRERTVEQFFTINWQSKGGLNAPSNMGVYTDTTIKLFGSASITGNVGTNSDRANSVELDGGAYINNGVIHVPESATNKAVKAPEYMKKPDREHPIPETVAKQPSRLELPPFPDFPAYALPPDKEIVKTEHEKHKVILDGNLRINNYLAENYTLQLHSDTTFKEIIIDQNLTVNIDTMGKDKAIVVDHLNVTNGHINIVGGGTLTIYVRDNITMNSGSTINKNGSVNDLVILLKGGSSPNTRKELVLGGSQVIKGSIFAEDANITFTSGGGFQGHILTGGTRVKLDGGVRSGSLIFAPNADFRLENGAKVIGSVISNSYYGDGDTNTTFEEVDISNLPFISSGDIPDNLLDPSAPKETN
ncbi:PilX N-terminal domain-containing pilus assembly protein [Aquibacillus koreensis]|uniref:PilX N-terminal domain-containing pilus assembly protein n=1 Tax=Aquibacillus koreensis TaxID=279446 RepID=A0A9X3WIV7_9BACI|nr:PilX N-terminal domain-containing pilus assembly protein [Aquibacillus koreensis]MCT2537943.1 PilX N-terminal domain-containing pilus assembly protein [Aquibacillus koreensis]MDC3419166.1 PilX N-terminal domain-containing pilus assembly protein [Aquibacillus koreensis]